MMQVEMFGGRSDGAVFDMPDGTQHLDWIEPVWTGRRWSITRGTLWRAPVVPQYVDGKPTGKHVAVYKYRQQIDHANVLS